MKQNNAQTIKNIGRLGDKYCEEHLKEWNKERLQRDWGYALEFFFWHSFMRGRKDKLSCGYCQFTLNVLKNYFHIDKNLLNKSYENLIKKKEEFDKQIILSFKKKYKIGSGNSLSDKYKEKFTNEISERNQLIEELSTFKEIKLRWDGKEETKRIHLGNDEDIMMVLDTLKFITSNEENKNIYTYLIDKIQNQEITLAGNELKKIRAVADKISIFVIRDILLINDMNFDFDFKQAFPLDTWVKQIAVKLNCEENTDEKIKEYLINLCKENGVNPMKFASGLWYLGVNSLDILMEILNKVNL